MKLTREGDLAMLIGGGRKRFMIQLDSNGQLQTHRGVLHHRDLIGVPWGSLVHSHSGSEFLLISPSMRDVLLHTKRQSQIVFPKDIGYILLRLSVGPGSTVIEAGTGSGALTSAFAWAVGPSGKVYSYDRREDMQELAQRNLQRIGLADRVEFRLQDIQDGFEQRGVDSMFLDLPQTENYLLQAHQALADGGTLGAVLPTTNQVSTLLLALDRQPFGLTEVCELMLRFYKANGERLRPTDRMVAHTGYLVFTRALQE